MAQYIEIDDGIALSGLRIVLTPGVPAPFIESIKSLAYVKKLPYVKLRHELLGTNVSLVNWTGQNSAPVAAWNEESPRSTWIGQLYLLERLAPEPRLIPTDWDDRLLMYGLCHEICGENGYTWNRRNLMVRDFTTPDKDPQAVAVFGKLGEKYGYTAEAGDIASVRCAEVLSHLSARLESQRAKGSRYFVGDGLTAADIYWACHAVTVRPLPASLCAMSDMFRSMYTNTDPAIEAAAKPILLEHRDYIYEKYLELPLDF